jgi:hypothetical protein
MKPTLCLALFLAFAGAAMAQVVEGLARTLGSLAGAP